MKLSLFNALFGFRNITPANDKIKLDDISFTWPQFVVDDSNISLKKGLFFHSIYFDKIKLSFWSKKQCHQALNLLTTHHNQYWFKNYQDDFKRIAVAAEHWQNTNHQFKTYIRHEENQEQHYYYKPVIPHIHAIEEFEKLGIELNAHERQFIKWFKQPKTWRVKHNKKRFSQALIQQNEFFDTVESQALTLCQRYAVYNDEQSTLVLAGAGTGKTSVIKAKIAYLVKTGLAQAEEICVLAFAKDAKDELSQRVYQDKDLTKVKISTFHSLGKEIIENYKQQKQPLIELSNDKLKFAQFLQDNLVKIAEQSNEIASLLVIYLSQFFYPEHPESEFKDLGDYFSHIKSQQFRSLKGEKMVNVEELRIANWLNSQGIQYQYQHDYKFIAATNKKTQYKPDFYLPELDLHIDFWDLQEQELSTHLPDIEQLNSCKEHIASLHKKFETVLVTLDNSNNDVDLIDQVKSEINQHCQQFNLKNQYNKPSISVLVKQLKEHELFNQLSQLIGLFIGHFKNSHLNIDELINNEPATYNDKRVQVFIRLMYPLLEAYDNTILQSQSLDYADMIKQALCISQQNDFHLATNHQYDFKYILVDEFQDISKIRACLIKSLKESAKRCALFCVGDDWQSIYRFAGSDYRLTSEFTRYFGYSETITLDTTFRFNNKISEVASSFISKNPNQLNKQLRTLSSSDENQIIVVEEAQRHQKLEHILDEINERVNLNQATKPDNSVLILARNNGSLSPIRSFIANYPQLNIKLLSVHKSKGCQAGHVIILDMCQGEKGFPSTQGNDPIIDNILAPEDDYPFAEERRLFYVALSRAKQRVYCLSPVDKKSEFIQELIDPSNNYAVTYRACKDEVNEQQQAKISHCPRCISGTVESKHGRYGVYYQCSNAPICKEKFKLCPNCNKGAIIRSGDLYTCQTCDTKHDVCPKCHLGILKIKQDKFWGCTQYSTTGCNYTRGL